MDSIIKEVLKCTNLKKVGTHAGDISKANVYQADDNMIFVKINKDEKSMSMFKGEEKSLQVIANTQTVRVPNPLAIFENPSGGGGIIMEHLKLKNLNRKAALLGDQIASLHLHNINREECNKGYIGLEENNSAFISQFGFPVPTFCGIIIQENDWCHDWVEFYGRKIDFQISLLQKAGDRTAADLWSTIVVKLPEFFKDITIKPSLLHGDLWAGNVGECEDGPVIYDPASLYGHHEFDLAIADMFGGFPKSFWDAYYAHIPKSAGWKARHELYKLFHYLNHWNHFGGGYKRSSLEIMKNLSKS